MPEEQQENPSTQFAGFAKLLLDDLSIGEIAARIPDLTEWPKGE